MCDYQFCVCGHAFMRVCISAETHRYVCDTRICIYVMIAFSKDEFGEANA